MSVQEVVQQVSYVTDPSGHPTAVQIQIELWEQIVVLLQQAFPVEATPAEQDAAWDLLLSLAEDAQPGRLENPSSQHDTYLYGQAA